MNNTITPENLFRLPWNLADNTISWLEPTSACNLSCDGCYRENRPGSHKSMEEIERELNLIKRLRKTDSISIAGGEPLKHPEIVEMVRLIKQKGYKPVINTNGELLTEELLIKLKEAGIFGFTFHIDSFQNRPGWKDKNELELNELRIQYAKMIRKVGGGLSCAFNATIYPETVQYIPELVKWAQENIDIVHIQVFILYRMAILEKEYDYYVGDQKIVFDKIAYSKNDDARRTNITSPEIVETIRQTESDFMPCAFLNGSIKADSYKWLLSGRLGNKYQIFGYVGQRFMEIVQNFNHLITGTYLAYSSDGVRKRGRLFFLLAPFDEGLRRIVGKYFKSFPENWRAFLSRIYYQTILIIQPADFMPNGDINMCDGCPDITPWGDELVWSCRLEEQLKWGENVRVVPK